MAKEHWILKMLWLGNHVPLAGRLQSRQENLAKVGFVEKDRI